MRCYKNKFHKKVFSKSKQQAKRIINESQKELEPKVQALIQNKDLNVKS